MQTIRRSLRFTTTAERHRFRPLSVHVRMLGTTAAAATAPCDFMLHLSATCEHHDGCISGTDDNRVSPPLSGAALSLFFQDSRDSLQKVTLNHMVLSEDQCLALATMSRVDVELTMNGCRLSNNTAGAFVECLRSDRGPVELLYCEIDNQIPANALTGDSRVTKLEPNFVLAPDDADLAILLRALANNRGLVDLDLRHHSISDENWTIFFESLQAHPTLTSLDVQSTIPMGTLFYIRLEHYQASRMRMIADMMEHNTILQTIHVSEELPTPS
jgi:hypothetical protein